MVVERLACERGGKKRRKKKVLNVQIEMVVKRLACERGKKKDSKHSNKNGCRKIGVRMITFE